MLYLLQGGIGSESRKLKTRSRLVFVSAKIWRMALTVMTLMKASSQTKH